MRAASVGGGDPQRPRAGGGRMSGERLGGRRRPGGIAELIACQHVEDRRGVVDGAREHTVDGQGGVPSSGAGEIRPRLGFRPTSPQQAAGIRIEPPPSLPWATGTMPGGDGGGGTAG